MKVIANSIQEAENFLNENSDNHLDYQIDGNILHEYNHKDEDLSVEWSWYKTKHPISGLAMFNFYC